jgi:hypothetical protein
VPGRENTHEHLRAFAGAIQQPDLPGQLATLLSLAVRAVPACLGVSLVLRGGLPPLTVPPMTVTAMADGAGTGPARASLAIELPRSVAEDHGAQGAAFVLYASEPLVFLAVVPSLLALLDLGHHRVTLDAHLVLPDPAAERVVLVQQLADRAVLARAMGFLLDRGMLADEAAGEIRRLAALRRLSPVAAARRLLEHREPESDR